MLKVRLCICLCLCLCACFPTRKSYKQGPHIRIAAVGDVMCHQSQLQSAYDPQCKCYRFDPVFYPVRKYLSDAHITLANLETTLPGDPYLYRGYPLFGSPDALVKALYRAGVDLLTLANNHSLDNGRLGLVRTIQVVRRLGFYHLGTYISQKEWEKKRVLLVRRRGFRLAFLNYSYGTNGIPIPRPMRVNIMRKRAIAADLALAHSLKPDAVIVFYHFGKEYRRWPDEIQRDYVRYAFRHGATVVLGAHSHVLQPYRIYRVKDIYGRTRKRLAAYSLGNFVSNQRWRYVNGGMIFYFDLVKKRSPRRTQAQILLGGISYEPTWVHVVRKKPRNQYYVLPVKEYLANDQEPRLPPREYRRMLQFFRDTQKHLRRSEVLSRRLDL